MQKIKKKEKYTTEIEECWEEEDKHKIYTGSATNRAYIQSTRNL